MRNDAVVMTLIEMFYEIDRCGRHRLAKMNLLTRTIQRNYRPAWRLFSRTAAIMIAGTVARRLSSGDGRELILSDLPRTP